MIKHTLRIPLLACLSLHPIQGQEATYACMCDASAAAALDEDRFAVANDEDNILRIYSRSCPGPPEWSLDLSSFLNQRGKSSEADLEGAARIKDRIYWISSHGRNAKGKERFDRHCLFATDIRNAGSQTILAPVGSVYRGLLQDLFRDPRLRPFNLEEASLRAPKDEGGLNIEGLCATPEGHLLIGFRNPVPNGKALVVPLLNPNDVIARQNARFGDPISLDLGGLGIRGMTLRRASYVIIAGSPGEGGTSHLFTWNGVSRIPTPLPAKEIRGLKPEGLFILGGSDRCVLVSDDGTLLVDGKPCKKLKEASRKRFRAVTIDLPSK